jgi:hypothetical protein
MENLSRRYLDSVQLDQAKSVQLPGVDPITIVRAAQAKRLENTIKISLSVSPINDP